MALRKFAIILLVSDGGRNELKSRFLHISLPSPKSKLVPSKREQAGEQAGEQEKAASVALIAARPSKFVLRLVDRIKGEMTVLEMMAALNLGGRRNFLEKYLLPAIEAGLVEMTQPDSPRSPTQRYRLTAKGREKGK